jgi:hypothetical protein
MNIVRLFTISALIVLPSLLAGCVSADLKDIRVSAESDPKTNLDGYKTYAWFAASAAVRDPDGEWTPTDLDIGSEIVRLVDNQLQAAGKVKVTTDPDILVAYGIGVDMKAMGLVQNPDSEAHRFVTIPKGGLTVAFFDPHVGRAIWAGSAEADLKEKPSVELVQKRLDYAVSQMFKKAKF